MTVYEVSISGREIADKGTHYQACPNIGTQSSTLTIRVDIATDFRKNLVIISCKHKKLN